MKLLIYPNFDAFPAPNVADVNTIYVTATDGTGPDGLPIPGKRYTCDGSRYVEIPVTMTTPQVPIIGSNMPAPAYETKVKTA
jgi:hypothetical protein